MPPATNTCNRALGAVLEDFQERFNFRSMAALGRVLGLAVNTVKALMFGSYPEIDRPSVPKDATLYQMAARMNAHAESKDHPWRTSYDELRAARDLDATRAREAS